ncbi:hypothetical protein H4R19_006626, partial [Coemansia spiralis]
MSAPSSMASNVDGGSSNNGGAGNTRPSSNSFSGTMSYTYGGPRGMSVQHAPHHHPHHHPQHRPQQQRQGPAYDAGLGLPGSSSSAPASTMMRAAAADAGGGSSSMLTDMSLTSEPHSALPVVSESMLMDAPPDLAHRRGLGMGMGMDIDRRGSGGGGGGRKYLGLGGPLGLGPPRRSTVLRSATTAAVLVHHPYAAGPMSAGPLMRSSPPGDRLGRLSPPRTAGGMPATRMHSTSQVPLLLSPVNLPPAPRHGAQRSGSYAGAQHISLAAIRRDVKEGPRRLPSISDNLRRESPPATAPALPSYSPGGLGIYNAGVPSSRTPSSLLPSPMPTP